MSIIRILLVLLLLNFISCKEEGPGTSLLLPHTYITFEEEDTSRSVTINFMAEGKGIATKVYYDKASKGGVAEDYKFSADGRVEFINGIDKTYHHVKLSNLQPATTYYFTYGDDNVGYSNEFKFTTLPADESEIRLLIGGDLSASSRVVETAIKAVEDNPHAIIVGGDIAYGNGLIKNEDRWIRWFEKMKEIMVTKDGRIIPLILAIGNHETSIGSALPGNKIPFYFTLFPQNKSSKSYFTKTFGNHMSLLILDSGHAVSHKSQESFVEENMKRFSHLSNKIAAYHAPMYPNYRSHSGSWAKFGRKYWLPSFDKYKLSAAFEHHDHTLKRTKILKGDKVSDKGTVYFGDGCWGTGTRESNEKWYLETSMSENHVWVAHFNKEFMEMKAMGKDGQILDHVKVTNTINKTIVEKLD